MDSVINRLRNTVSTVTSTVSQLSVVLPGNPVCREYEAVAQIASAGPGLLWKIYSGYKKSTRQEASVFIFEKKDLDKWPKKDRERMIEILKKGVQQLTKLRHPRILTVQCPLEESRESLAFATEPVLASLANVLGNKNSSPNSSALKDYTLDEIEIKYGLLQVAEGLQFLHRDAKLIHGNLCPESIILSEQGSWKIAGFEFTISPLPNEARWLGMDFEKAAHPDSRPNLDYVAPEYEKKPVPGSDLYSLGILTFAAYNHGETVFSSGGNLQAYSYNFSKLKSLTETSLRGIPQEIRSFIKSLFNSDPDLRPDSHDFSKLAYLDLDERVKTLSYLDSLFQLDNLQKSKFFKGLPNLLEKLPHRVRLCRVVPCLSGELLNPPMVPFVLPNLLKITEWSTPEEFVKHLLQPLQEAMKIKEPIQVLYIFLKNMDLLLQKTPPDFQKTDLLPLLYAALDTESTQMQELALGLIPSLAQRFDHAATKNQLLPRIRKITLSTQTPSVRVNCLVCLGKVLEDVEKWLVLDFVLPFLIEIPNREPPVIMAILGILKVAATHRKLGLTKELIATRVLPFLFPLTVENGLGMRQLEILLAFIQELIAQVTKEQTAKIKTINSSETTDISSTGMEELFPGFTNGISKPKKENTLLMPERSNPVQAKPLQVTSPSAQQPRDLVHTLMNSQINQLTISPTPVNNNQQIFLGNQNIPTRQQHFSSFQNQQTFQQPPSAFSRPNYVSPTQNSNSLQNLMFLDQKFSTSVNTQQAGAKTLSVHEIDELLK